MPRRPGCMRLRDRNGFTNFDRYVENVSRTVAILRGEAGLVGGEDSTERKPAEWAARHMRTSGARVPQPGHLCISRALRTHPRQLANRLVGQFILAMYDIDHDLVSWAGPKHIASLRKSLDAACSMPLSRTQDLGRIRRYRRLLEAIGIEPLGDTAEELEDNESDHLYDMCVNGPFDDPGFRR